MRSAGASGIGSRVARNAVAVSWRALPCVIVTACSLAAPCPTGADGGMVNWCEDFTGLP